MPDARYGANAPITFRMGGMQVEALYYGADLIWPAGHIISILADEINWTDYAPLILSGVHVRVPVDVMSWQDFEPSIELDGVAIPVDSLDWTDYAPSVSSGAHVLVPLDAMQWADFAPAVAVSAIVDMPLDTLAWMDFAPTISAGAHIKLPFDTMEWADFTPLLSGGASVSVPVDAWKWSEFAPNLGYAFSKAFSSAFNAVPHDYGVVVPVDGWGWSDFAPEVDAASNVDFAYVETVAENSTINIGPAASNRYVFAVVTASAASAPFTLNSATIGGVPATIHSQSDGELLAARMNVAIISALVPSGTSAAVTTSYNRSGALRFISSYRVTGLANNVAIQQNSTAFDDTGSSWSRDLDVIADGFALSCTYIRNAGGQVTSSNMTRDDRRVAGDFSYQMFHSLEGTTQSGRTFNFSNANGSGRGSFVIATFR